MVYNPNTERETESILVGKYERKGVEYIKLHNNVRNRVRENI